jgi:hypothetical protein
MAAARPLVSVISVLRLLAVTEDVEDDGLVLCGV